jgi:spore coat protein SA
MKILMIGTEKLPIPPILGGAIQTYIAGTLPYLSKVHDITVLGISNSQLSDQETVNGIRYVRVPGMVFEIYKEHVVKFVEANEFDLIHIFNRPRLVLPIKNVAPNSRITLSMHNDMFNPEKISPEEATAVLEHVSQIVTVSDYVGNVIRELYPQSSAKIRTIYSGVDSERFLPGNHPKMQKRRNEIRKAHGLENKTVILFAGRLSHNKGVDRLIRALPDLSKKFKNLALVIVGSKWFSQEGISDYVAYVRALAKRLPIPVVTTGYVAQDEIQNWFAAADLFVCTSQWQEPLARVHYEAMAAGLPIVTTARGGNPEVIIEGVNGLIVKNPEDPKGFVDAISAILSDKSLIKKMGEEGRNLAVSKYRWDRVASELLKFWEDSMQSTVTELTDINTISFEQPEQVFLTKLKDKAYSQPESTPSIKSEKKKSKKDQKKLDKKSKKEQKKREEKLKKEQKKLKEKLKKDKKRKDDKRKNKSA